MKFPHRLIALLIAAFPFVSFAQVLFPTNGHFYDLIGFSGNWDQAKVNAESRTSNGLRGHLATINDAQEQEFLSMSFSQVADGKHVWIGGFQPSSSSEPNGGWTWLSGEPFGFTNWIPGEPNNASGIENVLLFYGGGYAGAWNDFPSDLQGDAYIIEFEDLKTRSPVAISQVVNGFVIGATVIDGGSGYTNTPSVRIVAGNGSGATARATVVYGVVTAITIVNSGHGYTGTPSIEIDPPPYPPTQAKGTTSVINGFVTGVTITDSGHGYGTNIPSVYFIGGGGSGATAVAIVENDIVTGVTITGTGSGYTTSPKVLIAAPAGVPSLAIEVSQVRLNLKLIAGYSYKIQTSTDARSWTDTGASFLATDSIMTQVFDVKNSSQLFRLVQVP